MQTEVQVRTHRVPEPVEREILLNGPLVQNDVNRDAPGGSVVEIGNYCAIRQSVCHDGDNLLATQKVQSGLSRAE